nr:MAG TPA: Nucleoside 2-deoxyribosyltransferase like protein [Caudoviricetes sp.]
MTVYIAGGITGVENYKARFAAAKEWLLAEKETQEVARGLLKVSPYPTADVVLNPAELPADWPGKVYMDVCLAMIRAADLVAFLPGWEQSRGASLEMQYSRYEGKPVYKIEEDELEGWMED